MNTAKMTLQQIRVTGLRALARELGPVGFIRFMQQFEMGEGDYTLEREQWLAGHSIHDVVQQIQRDRECDEHLT